MKYCLMLEDGQYRDNNFALVVINANRAGRLDNLVVLKSNSSFHTKLEIEPNTVVITDKFKNFFNRSMELIKVKNDEIQETYLEYLERHELDGTPKKEIK